MSRPAGQVTTLQAVVGLGVALVLATTVIAGLSSLIARPRSPASGHAPPATAVPMTCPVPLSPGVQPVLVTSALLAECPRSYDGAEVRYRGEAVGMVLRRGPRAWVQLNDDAYGLGGGPLPAHGMALGPNAGTAVLVPTASVGLIDTVGGPHAAGTLVEVEGTFQRAAPIDAGAPAIIARTVAVLARGAELHEPLNRLQALTAGVLVLLTATGALAIAAARRRG